MGENSKKIKVCFVSPFAYPLFNPETDLKFGGAEVQMYLLATELAKDENFDVNFVALDLGQKEKEEYGGVKVYKSYQRGRNIFNLIKASLKQVLTLKKINSDVVISRAAGVEVGLSAFYCKLFRKKFIYSIASNKDVDKSRFQGIRGRFFKFGFERADFLIAQTKKQIDILEKTYKKSFKNIKIIPNSFNIKKNINSTKKDFVLWVGSSIGVKRPDIFLELAEQFPQEKFVMIMTKSKAGLERWEKIKKRADKLSNLELIEKVPFKKMDDYFACAKVFVNTSATEGFPNTFLQAMMNKTPILSLNVDPDGFIKNNNCGLISDNSFDLLVSKLEKLLSDQNLRDTISKNGYNYMLKNYDMNKNIERWKEFLKHLK